MVDLSWIESVRESVSAIPSVRKHGFFAVDFGTPWLFGNVRGLSPCLRVLIGFEQICQLALYLLRIESLTGEYRTGKVTFDGGDGLLSPIVVA